MRQQYSDNKELAGALLEYADEFFDEHRLEDALEHYRLSLKYDGTNPDAHYNYAFCLEFVYRTPEGLECKEEVEYHYEKAIELEPNEPIYLSRYALLLAYKGEMERAGEIHRRIITLEEDVPAHHSEYACYLATIRRYSEAEKHFKKAIELSDGCSDEWVYYYNYASMLRDIGRFEEAELYFAAAFEKKH